MRTSTLFVLACALWALPAVARANGVAFELGILWPAPQESALRAVAQRADVLSTIGLGGAWTVGRLGDFRVDALACWGASSSEAVVGSDLPTSLLEHSFALGARVRWARLYFLQPYVALRAGPAFGWFDVAGNETLESFDAVLRVEPTAGVEAFFPLWGVGGRLPPAGERTAAKSGWPGGGLGIGLDVGYRFQSAYRFDAAPAEPADEDVARDAIPRDGPRLGELTLSGVRMGINLTLRF